MSQQDLDNYELANKVAELTLDVERLKAENMALRARLTFTGNYEIVTHTLREPVILRGRGDSGCVYYACLIGSLSQSSTLHSTNVSYIT